MENFMSIRELLAMNLKFCRKKYNLSQEKFAEILGTTLSYLNHIENCKVDIKASTIDKFAKNICAYDSKAKMTPENLIKYDKRRVTNFSRIDQRKKD